MHKLMSYPPSVPLRMNMLKLISHLHLWQQIGQGTDGSGLASAAVSHDHDAANLGVNDVEDESQLHLLLPNNGSEGEDRAGGTWEGEMIRVRSC